MGGITLGDPLAIAEEEAMKSDLAIVFGSSMKVNQVDPWSSFQIGPFCNLPSLAKEMVLVTLQPTSYDEEASLVLHAPCDQISRSIANKFNVPLTDFSFEREAKLTLAPTSPSQWEIKIASLRPNEPCPWVSKATLTGHPEMERTIEGSFETLLSNVSEGKEIEVEIEFAKIFEAPKRLLQLHLGKEQQTILLHCRKEIQF